MGTEYSMGIRILSSWFDYVTEKFLKFIPHILDKATSQYSNTFVYTRNKLPKSHVLSKILLMETCIDWPAHTVSFGYNSCQLRKKPKWNWH